MEINNYSKELMVRQQRTLAKMRKADIRFISDFEDWAVPFLNELTKELKSKNKISYYEQVNSIWFTDGTEGSSMDYVGSARVILQIRNTNWDCYSMDSGCWLSECCDNKRMSVDVLNMVLDCFDRMIDYCEGKKAKNGSNIDISELLTDFLYMAERNIDNGQYKVSIKYGKLVKEGNTSPYDTLIVEYPNGGYVGSILFDKDRCGRYTITCRVPLGGDSSWGFTLDTAEDEIKTALKWICG